MSELEHPAPSITARELAPRPEPPPPPTYLIDVGAPAFWTNIAVSTQEGKALVLKCHGKSDVNGDRAVNQVFPTRHLLAHPVEITDEQTGESFDCVRSVLIGPAGETLSFVSHGILRSLKVLVALYGRGPWEPPLPLAVKQVQTRNSRRTYVLEVADNPATPGQNRG